MARGDGFVFSQSLRGTKSDSAYKAWALSDEIFALVGEEAPRRWMRTSDIKALFAKGKTIRWR